jgi:protoheme IX farnesyltransferase
MALSKAKLSSLVVFTSVLGYVIVAGSQFSFLHAVLLAAGGFLTTAAANTLNQVLERDFDALMKRTENRPLPTSRLTTSAAVIYAGMTCLVGICLLATFNPLTALLGMLSLIMYAFVYTPLKRYSTVAVSVGAIPGALPILIGCTSFTGEFTMLAIVLFALQFCWQFPHFWSIGYLSYDDYKNAGYKLMPSRGDVVDPSLGYSALVYAVLLIPISGLIYLLGGTLIAAIVSGLLAVAYAYYTYLFARQPSRETARKTMFASFFYLPLVLIAIWCI